MKIRTMNICSAYCVAAALAAFPAVGTGPAYAADPAPAGRMVKTPLHVFTVDDIGLPAQLEITATTKDLPLAYRTLDKKRLAPVLKMIHRGPQFASPMRIEAIVDKAVVPAKADAPATLNKTDKGTEAVSTWQAGSLKGRLSVLYADDGSMT